MLLNIFENELAIVDFPPILSCHRQTGCNFLFFYFNLSTIYWAHEGNKILHFPF